MRIISIRTRILAIILLTGLVISLSLGALWIYNAHETNKSNAEQYGLRDSRLIASHVEMYVKKAMGATGIIAADPNTVAAVKPGDAARIKPIANNLFFRLVRRLRPGAG